MAADPLVVWIAVACIATLFAHAAMAKLADRALFEQHLAGYGVPDRLRPAAVWALPLLETALALALLSPWRALGGVAAAVLLSVYGLAMAWHRAQGHALDCGCGGEPLPLSWTLVLRNGLLAALALLAGMPMAPRALAGADFLVIAAALLLATLLHAALHQVLRHRARLSYRS
jgi:hypothetical protein